MNLEYNSGSGSGRFYNMSLKFLSKIRKVENYSYCIIQIRHKDTKEVYNLLDIDCIEESIYILSLVRNSKLENLLEHLDI